MAEWEPKLGIRLTTTVPVHLQSTNAWRLIPRGLSDEDCHAFFLLQTHTGDSGACAHCQLSMNWNKEAVERKYSPPCCTLKIFSIRNPAEEPRREWKERAHRYVLFSVLKGF
jgi:hypothetical protein